MDLLGSGFSDRPSGFGYSIREHAETVVTVLNALDLVEVDLYGHSMGGSIAIEAAGLLGSRVRHLVLSEPNLHPGGGIFSRAIAAQSQAGYVAEGHAATIDEATQAGNLMWAGSMAIADALAVHRAATSLVRGSSPSWYDQLRRLTIPRVVLFGARSLPDPDFDALRKDGITVAVIPDAGHSMAEENPSGLAHAIAGACA
jgi:pimeloyl-ACP methyl ester carboxylesterase